MAPELPLDIDWLRDEVSRLFRLNRVRQIRSWKERCEITYHAPSLPQETPRSPWQRLLQPWRVAYPHQWFWDSTAHIIVLRHLDLNAAKSELHSLLYCQEPSGFIPHLIWNTEKKHWVDRLLQFIFPSPHYSPYIQPPMLAKAAAAVFEVDRQHGFLKEIAPRVKSYYLYLHQNRDPGDGLLEIVHPYESGRDRAAEWEIVLRSQLSAPFWKDPLIRLLIRHWCLGWDSKKMLSRGKFRVKDLMFNCIYAWNLRELARLLEFIGDPEASFFKKLAERTETAILKKLYDPQSGFFCSLGTLRGIERLIRKLNATTFMVLLLENLPWEKARYLIETLVAPDRFWTAYPVPVEPGDVPCKETIWQGSQTWVYLNWFIFEGLRFQACRFPEERRNFLGIAEELAVRTLKLVRKSGFREFYDSRTGEGKRAYNFGWSSLVLDMLYNIKWGVNLNGGGP